MPFLGVEPVQEFASVAKQTITGTGATAYSLDHSVASANDLAVFVNNVRQEPTSAYTASGGTITFTSALASTDSCYVMYIARTFSSATAEANSVGITELNVSDGTSGQALTTNGSGTLSFSTISAGLTGITDNATASVLTLAGGSSGANSVIQPVNSNFASGFYGSSTDFGFRISDGGVGGKTVSIVNNAATVLSHNQVNDVLYIGAGKVAIGFFGAEKELEINLDSTTTTTLGQKGGLQFRSPSSTVANGGEITWSSGSGNTERWCAISGHITTNTVDGSTGDLVFATKGATTDTTPSEGMRILSGGNVKLANQLYFGSNLGDVISLYDDRLGDANMYGFGVESSALFSRSVSLFNWYVNQTNNGSSYAMQLNGNGRLTLKGSQNSANAAQVYFIDDGSPGLVGGIEFTGTFGNGGGYHSSLQTSGELQYSAAGHFFADTSVVSSGIPGFWCRMNGDMTIGTYGNFSSVLTEYLFDVSTGHLHIDGTLYQNSSSTNSDSKMKENVVTLTNCLNKVSQLRGVEFDWKDEYVREAYHDVGLIAQEVESVIPEVVSQHEIGVGKKAGTGETLKSVDYSRLTAVLIEAVKELKTQNEALETRIATLESN